MAPPDLWCDNCKQMVSPSTPVGVVARSYVFWGLGAFIALLVVAGFATGNMNGTAIVTLLLFAVVVAVAALRPRPREVFCPICRSRRLADQAPSTAE